MAAWICVVLLRYKPQYTWPGLILVLLGVPVYLMWKRTGTATARTEHQKANLVTRESQDTHGESFVTKPLDSILGEAAETGEHTLKRTLGAGSLIALGIGAIIGTGIFVLTGPAAAQLCRPGRGLLLHRRRPSAASSPASATRSSPP